jgi:hypothetical protein
VFPCGSWPSTITLAFAAGQTVANSAVVPVDPATGAICVVATAPTNVVVDLTGWLHSDGGYHPTDAVRVFDSRPSGVGPRSGATTKLAAGSSFAVQVADLLGHVPPQHVSAVVMNLTVVAPERAGWVAAHTCGEPPATAHVAFVAGQTVSNMVVVPVEPTSGTVCISTSARTHLVVDLSGWYDDRATATTIAAVRWMDTRVLVRPRRTTTVRLHAADLVGLVPGWAADTAPTSLVLNVTVSGATGVGGVSVHQCDAVPLAPNINHFRTRTSVATVLVPVDESGDVCITATTTAHLMVDVVGWFVAPRAR